MNSRREPVSLQTSGSRSSSEKTKSRPSAGGFPISFKALEDYDEEELTTCTGQYDKLAEKEEKIARHLGALKKQPPLPLTAKFSESKGVLPQKQAVQADEKKTLLANIKGKIHKKWEEFSGESSSSPENENEKSVSSPVRKQSSEDSAESGIKVTVEDKPLAEQSDHEANPHCELEDRQTASFLVVETPLASDFREFPLVEDFTSSETFENHNRDDTASLDTILTQSPTRPPRPSLRSRMRGKQARTTEPIAMSSLLHQSKAEEELIDKDGSVYYDADENRFTPEEAVPQCNFLPTREKAVPIRKLVITSAILFIYFLIPLPSYIDGIIMGAILSSAVWGFYTWLNKPLKPQQHIVLPQVKDLPPLSVPEMKEPKQDDRIYKGWMNELVFYDPDNYHINQSHSVYVRLEKTSLRLSRPKNNVPRRAMFDEIIPNPQFIHQRHFDLVNSKVYLQPAGLVQKRLWSKKYPICIVLPDAVSKKSTGTTHKHSRELQTSDMGFEIVSDGGTLDVLYLFARTGREKEEWFKRFSAASNGVPLENHIWELQQALDSHHQHKRSDSDSNLKLTNGIMQHKRHNSMDLPILTTLTNDGDKSTSAQDNISSVRYFAQYMGRLMPSSSSNTSRMRKDLKDLKMVHNVPISDLCENQFLWLNALIGRCLWDFLKDRYWTEKVMEKLQRKLSKIHVPYFIEDLKITDIDIGTEVPILQKSSKPYLDDRGFWVDMQVVYRGGFKMTIATKVNLMKLKKKSSVDKSPEQSRRSSAITDSNEEDSAESSTDEECEESSSITGVEEGSLPAVSGGASRKILKYINKITRSKYFQQATEYKYIKKAMEEVSNTPLVLTVELHYLMGILTVNVPPPPSDRLWYGFRGNPQLSLVAKPKVGEREVTVTHVTEWIEKKLTIEFQRIFVLPNMDDLVIPLLLSGLPADAVPAAVNSDVCLS